jgi:spore maturation protein CgeB
MRFVMFYHSLVSDWNHGNAHFLRGIVSELLARGHDVAVYEPERSWSLRNLIEEHGQKPLRRFRTAYPGLSSTRYRLPDLDWDEILEGADVVLVHEWNDPVLVKALGRECSGRTGCQLFFHDTHHRMVTDPAAIGSSDLNGYDGVLAYGRVLRDLYRKKRRARRAWTWHEAADTRVFRPLDAQEREGDLVWIGNWGDGERTKELEEFLIKPIKALRLKARVYGVRYPASAQRALADAGIEYGGWLPNFDVPKVFARFKLTIHIPRRPYVKALPGIPTIRVFEALACGIPMVCSPWKDSERLFTPGQDFVMARSGREVIRQFEKLLTDEKLAREVGAHGRRTILDRHSCAHRVDELLDIVAHNSMG